MWVPDFACPVCRAAVCEAGGVRACEWCGQRFSTRDGIHRFATADALVNASAFLNQYRAVRRADGHAVLTAERYRSLPDVPSDDPNAGEWRIRRQSLRTLTRLREVRGILRVLDLGAGSAWLSNRLAALGHAPVAVDLDDDGECGLGAAATWAEHQFPLVQADFARLPFAPNQFDLVVWNAALHYAADPEATLLEANRMLAPGGVLVVMDSPMFENGEAGESMVARQTAMLASRYGMTMPVRRGRGYLTFDVLQRAACALERRAMFIPSMGSPAWRVRRAWSRVRLGRAPAMFGVWVAR